MVDIFHKGLLENSIKYYVYGDENLEENMMLVSLTLNIGSLQDSSQKGIAHFIEHLNLSFAKKQRIKDLNYKYFGVTDFHHTTYTIKAKSTDENINIALSLLYDIAIGKYIKTANYDFVKIEVLEEYERFQNSYQYNLNKIVLSGYPFYSDMPIGDINCIKNFNLNNIYDFFNDYYTPDRMCICIIGNKSTKYCVDKIKQIFELLKTRNKKIKFDNINQLPSKLFQTKQVILQTRRDDIKCIDLFIQNNQYKYDDNKYYIKKIYETILIEILSNHLNKIKKQMNNDIDICNLSKIDFLNYNIINLKLVYNNKIEIFNIYNYIINHLKVQLKKDLPNNFYEIRRLVLNSIEGVISDLWSLQEECLNNFLLKKPMQTLYFKKIKPINLSKACNYIDFNKAIFEYENNSNKLIILKR